MTTIDPHDFSQPGLKASVPVLGTTLVDFSDFKEPTIQVWENVTFADNYYQNIANPDGSWTPNGREIVGADININLNGRTGFRFDDGLGGPHSRVLSWYAGTLNLADENLSVEYLSKPIENLPVLDQLSDFALSIPKDEAEEYLQSGSNLGLWYSNLGQLNPSTEGIGLGWANSVQAGGTGRRIGSGANLQSLTYDNTATQRMRGDYAVSTLFDGDFDSVSDPKSFVRNAISTSVPGWSFHNDGKSLTTNFLISKSSITTLLPPDPFVEEDGTLLSAPLRAALGADEIADYVVQLGDKDSITHDRFLIPDWGTLRFDLHVAKDQLGVGRNLKVWIQSDGIADYDVFKEIGQVNLIAADGTRDAYADDRYKIDYGTRGFETFNIDIPDVLRGRTATLKFKSDGGTVDLDNIFFKSQQLSFFGNPDNARYSDQSFADNPYPNNLLIEKPQYTLSYNDNTKTPNWVSWELNKDWLGSEKRPIDDQSYFQADPELPGTGWNAVKYQDYTGSGFSRGHMSASNDRSRGKKDILSTYLMTNILPQNQGSNNGPWKGLERYARSLANSGKELYLIAGGYGTKTTIPGKGINVPERVWKVILVLEPSQGGNDLSNARVIAVDMPNDATTRTEASWVDYIVTAQDIENAVKKENPSFKIFSTLSIPVQNALKTKKDSGLASSLLSDVNVTSLSEIVGTFPNESVVVNGLKVKGSDLLDIFENRSSTKVGLPQIGTSQSYFEQSNVSQDSLSQIGTSQISFFQLSPSQISTSQVGTSQISTSQVGTSQISTSQVGTDQRYIDQLSLLQVGINQTDAVQGTKSKIDASQINAGKISFSNVITLQQFFNVHNISPTLIYDINNTALTLWDTSLQTSIPLNLNIEIKDLPTGQLAEAQVTQFNAQGTPLGGTLYLDYNGNDLGWFIDPTPWDNSEYSQTLTDTAYRATTDSAAYGHYDLLTTFLHETSHLQGFIAGYSTYSLRERYANDSHIQTLNGSKTFVGDGFSAILTPDGSHLSSSRFRAAYEIFIEHFLAEEKR
jgi:large repetitive protein